MTRFLGRRSRLGKGIRHNKAPLAFFFLMLLFFVINGAWHVPSRLVLTGRVEGAVDALLQWDSGSGLNGIETAPVVLGQLTPGASKATSVKITRTGGKHPSADGTGVWIKTIQKSNADKPLLLDAFVVPGMIERQEDVLHLMQDGASLVVPAGRESTTLLFLTSKASGFVEIDVNGDKRQYDLYAAEEGEKTIVRDSRIWEGGSFTTNIELPRYQIHRLAISAGEPSHTFQIDRAFVVSERGTRDIDFLGKGSTNFCYLPNLQRNTKQYFHPVHFLQQAIFAALFACIVWHVMRIVRRKGGVGALVLEGKRPAFWLMLLGSWPVFFLWLLAYWPGHFTSDSVHIWWAARNPGFFLYQHPVLNVIFYRFLQQFWDHLAVVPLFQITATSALGSYIFYYLYKEGVTLWIVIPFFLAFITSIPVGLYNVSLWKDVPFALLVLFWAFYFVKTLHEKRRDGRSRFTSWETASLLALLLAMGLFRYNGVIYLFLIPLGMVLFGIIPWKRFLIATVAVLFLSAVIIGIAASKDDTGFVSEQTRHFLKRIADEPIAETVRRTVKQYPTILDVNTYKKRAIWYDIWRRDKGTTDWHYAFAREKGYNEFLRYVPSEPKSSKLHGFLDRLTHDSYEIPWVYLTWNPVYMLFVFLGCAIIKVFPRAAGYGYVILTQVLALLLVLGTSNYNWRYYYFLHLSALFLVPVMALDIKERLCPQQAKRYLVEGICRK